MIFKNQKIQKIITVIILIAVVGPPLLVPRRADAIVGMAANVVTAKQTTIIAIIKSIELALERKKWLKTILETIAKTVAKRALANITRDTVNWINSGFHGKPLFLENPDSFFKDITKFEIRNLVDTFGYNSARYPYGRGWSLGVINAYKSQLDYNAAYSLSNVINDEAYLSNYRNNFNIGGFNGLLLHTQYPQNNAIGFLMIANEALSGRIDRSPGADNEVGKVQDLLQQGQGFLAPQVCRSNPSLVQNPYNPPTFNYEKQEKWDPPDINFFNGDEDAYDTYMQLYAQAYNERKAAAQGIWKEQNTCTGGWANTTPGYVAATQITRALGSNFAQKELGIALGASLSAVFDALASKLFTSGLNALASNTNPPPETPDNWDYLGNTLGSPTGAYGYNDSPFIGPDEEIILGEFKKAVAQGLADTQAELALLDNPNSINYGVTQYLSAIWPKVRDLDICLPGPNLGWEQRLDDEVGRAGTKIQEKMNDKNAEKASQATLVFKELQFAVSFFKDWMKTKTLFSLPSAFEFLDAISETETYDQQMAETTDKKRTKLQAVAWLQGIKSQLESFTDQPLPGTREEAALISLRKKYDTVRYAISNTETIEETKARLDALWDKLSGLNAMVNKCASERQERGWNIPPRTGNPPSSWNDSTGESSILLTDNNSGFFARGTTYFGKYFVFFPPIIDWAGSASLQVRTGTEKEQFCSRPISGGYTHDVFINPNDPTPGGPNVEYNQLPLINTKAKTKNAGNFVIILSCNTIFRSSPIDYKGNIPGKIEINEPPPSPDDTGESSDADAPPPPPPACDPAIDPNCVPPPPPPSDETPPDDGCGEEACL